MSLKVPEQLKHLIVDEIARLEPYRLILIIITVNQFYRKGCIEILPACDWTRVNPKVLSIVWRFKSNPVGVIL